MKKKRFIKLLMAMGCRRNKAAAEAAVIARLGGSYEKYYRSLYRILAGSKREEEHVRRLVNANFGDEICATFVYE